MSTTKDFSGCILFDLDGTLLDTAPDMALALNRLRLEEGIPALPFEQIRPAVSYGATAMIKVGFGLFPDELGFEDLRQRFLVLYQGALVMHTTLFPGMAQTLDQLEARAIAWGVVTNKPGWLTEPLLKALKLWGRAACVVSGDTLTKRKPDPEPLLHACQLLGAEPKQSVYVGDAERDIEAGRRADMTTLAACFGYIPADEDPALWGADGLLDRPEDLLIWLEDAKRLSLSENAIEG